jgi:hypothetical protein
MSCWEFSTSRPEACPPRSGSPSISCRHSYRRLRPRDGCHHYRALALRHRRIPEEYGMPYPGPETEDAPEEEEASRSEDDETSSGRPQDNSRY